MSKVNEKEQSQVKTPAKRTRQQAFCPLCETEVDLLSLDQAAEHCSTEPEEISRLIQNRSIHCLHNRKGAVLICFNSLRSAYSYVRETARLSSEKIKILSAGKTG